MAFFSTTLLGQTQKIEPSIYKKVNKKKMNQWVDSVFNQMSLDQRIGQLFIIVPTGSTKEKKKQQTLGLINNQSVGGLMFLKGTVDEQAEITNAAQKKSKVPLMVTIDGEWGLSMRLANTTKFPRNMMLGAIQDDSLLYLYGKEMARQCKLMGIQVNFAPDLDVNSNPKNPVIGTRSYGEDPNRVAQLGIMYAKGLESGNVMPVAKHFPGHGDTSTDSHHTLPLISHDKKRLYEYEIYPFKKYIEAGLSGIMVGHLNVPALDKSGLPSSLSKIIVTDVLQDELGFSGLIFTDGLQMKGVTDQKDHCVKALLAGNDILLGPTYPAQEFATVKKAVADKIISEELINEKCKKILAYKYILGLNNYQPIKTENLLSELSSTSAEQINRELNQKAMTLLKNDDNIIPIKNLENRKIAAVSIGGAVNNTFHKTLKLYGDVKCFNVPNAEGLSTLKKTLSGYNTIIVSVYDNKTNANLAIQNLGTSKGVILTFFANPYSLTKYEGAIKSLDGLLLAYENTALAQEYAAQAIFGGSQINGKLPVSVGKIFEVGEGITTKKIRLGYGLPEEVGVSSKYLNEIENIVKEGIDNHAYPGCQVLVAKNGVVIYNESFGTFAYNSNKPVTNDAIYDIASMTKATSTLPAIMKLYDEKKITLNDPLSDYISALKNTDKSKITIRQALLHETGLTSFIPYYMNAIDKSSYEGKLFNRARSEVFPAEMDESTWGRTDYKYKPEIVSTRPKNGFLPLADNMYVNKAYKDTIISSIANSKLRPKKTYLYSCLNFMLLKEVVEKETNTDLNSYTQEAFFLPLGATTTTYNPLTKFEKEEIVPTEKDDFLRKQLIQGYAHDEGAAFMGGVSGNAGLFSNANDLAKLYQMYLNGGTYGGDKYFSSKTAKIFTDTQSGTSRRGLGFDKPEPRTNKSSPTSVSTPLSTYGHTGFTGTCFWVDPDNELIYIFLSNRINEKRSEKGLMKLGIRSRIQEQIYKAIKNK